jgi:hypothetical protein
MAAIGITISNKKLVSIKLDVFEWTQLYVNDKPVPGNSYQQTEPGTLTFKAYATGDLVPVNPPVILEVKNEDSSDESTGILNFSAISLTDGSTLCTGLITTEKGYTKNAQKGPLHFNQGRMTGLFTYES